LFLRNWCSYIQFHFFENLRGDNITRCSPNDQFSWNAIDWWILVWLKAKQVVLSHLSYSNPVLIHDPLIVVLVVACSHAQNNLRTWTMSIYPWGSRDGSSWCL
jgi:hypothetical protein